MNQPIFTAPVDCHADDGNYFARFAEPAFANGYSVIPLTPGQKKPRKGRAWRDACWTRMPAEEVGAHAADFPDSGVGLACGRHTVVFDIDVDSAETANAIGAIVVDICGPTPLVRIGSQPRFALVYRSLEPIVSIRLPRFDILGLGCQLVAYGVHPRTGGSYRWVGGTAPHLIDLGQIPGVTNAQTEAVASEVLRRIYGDRFERFVFDTDMDLMTLGFSSRSTLTKQWLMSVFRGRTRARQRFRTLVMDNEIPPGFWGFSMRPVVRGGFNHGDFIARLERGELVDARKDRSVAV